MGGQASQNSSGCPYGKNKTPHPRFAVLPLEEKAEEPSTEGCPYPTALNRPKMQKIIQGYNSPHWEQIHRQNR